MKTTKYVCEPTKLFLIVGIVILCIGMGIIIGTSIYGGMTLAKLDRYTVTTGTVVDYKITIENSHGSSGTPRKVKMYAEIAEFEVDGVTYRVTNGISSANGVKDIGENVKIAYNPEEPADCIFITSNNVTAIILIVVLGAAFIGAGIALILYYRRDYKAWKLSKQSGD